MDSFHTQPAEILSVPEAVTELRTPFSISKQPISTQGRLAIRTRYWGRAQLWGVSLFLGIACVVPSVLFAQQPATGGRVVEVPDIERLRAIVRELSSEPYEGRGTVAGKRKTREYLTNEFRRLGLNPLFEGKSYEQLIPGPRDFEAPATSPTPVYGFNVGGWLPLKDGANVPNDVGDIVILSAHFDHLGMRGGKLHPGADDNASGVAMLLESARLLSQPGAIRRQEGGAAGIAFVAFDLEEYLLWGSRWFAAHPPWPLSKIRLFITADMIGRSLGDLPLSSIYVMGTEHADGLRELVDQCAAKTSIPRHPLDVALLGTDLVGTRGDYGPFRDANVPYLFFSSGEHPDYHTPRDTFERVHFDKVTAVTRLMAEVTRRAAEMSQSLEWRESLPIGLDEVRSVRQIAQLLLERDEAVVRAGRPGLGEWRRGLVTSLRAECDRLIKRGRISDEDRPALVRSARLLLLTVF